MCRMIATGVGPSVEAIRPDRSRSGKGKVARFLRLARTDGRRGGRSDRVPHGPDAPLVVPGDDVRQGIDWKDVHVHAEFGLGWMVPTDQDEPYVFYEGGRSGISALLWWPCSMLPPTEMLRPCQSVARATSPPV